MIANLTQKFAEHAIDKPIEITVIVLGMLGCGIVGMGLLLIHDKILK